MPDKKTLDLAFGATAMTINGLSIFILIIILFNPNVSRTAYIHQINLAMADAGVGAYLIVKSQLEFNRRACTALIGCGITTIYASLFSIALFAVDRYFFLYHEVYYETWFNSVRTVIGIIGAWSLSVLVGFVPLKWSNKNKLVCDVASESRPTSVLFRCLIALITICFVLYVLGIVIHKQVTNYPTTTLPSFVYTRSRFSYGVMSKGYIISKSIIIGFNLLAFWVPHTIASIYYDLQTQRQRDKLDDLITGTFLYMLYFNSIVNPLVYEWFHYGFQSFILKHCCPHLIQKTPSMRSVTSTSRQ